MTEFTVNFFVSFFQNPSAWGIGLAIAFGAIWLACYRPPLFKRPGLWAILVSSAILALAAVSFIQIPLQYLVGQALGQFWSQEMLMRWLLLAGIKPRPIREKSRPEAHCRRLSILSPAATPACSTTCSQPRSSTAPRRRKRPTPSPRRSILKAWNFRSEHSTVAVLPTRR